MNCRLCSAPLSDVFLDLGAAPPSNAFLSPAALARPETYFPLKLFTCATCFLVQVDEVQPNTSLFAPDYAYYSSFSRSWLAHAQRFVGHAVEKLGLNERSLVVEVASNDGYLLQYMAERRIPCVGIEPTKGTADAARAKGIDTVCEFFGDAFAQRFARERGSAHLIVANNVLAHVPDLHDFVAGLASVLAPNGVISVEFPHLQRLVAKGSSTRSIMSIFLISHCTRCTAHSPRTDCASGTWNTFPHMAARSGYGPLTWTVAMLIPPPSLPHCQTKRMPECST